MIHFTARHLLTFILPVTLLSCSDKKEKADNVTTTKKVITTDKAPQPAGPYSQAILAGNTMYVAGQIGVSPSTNQLDTTGFEGEAYQALRNLINILEAGGMNADNVVSTRVYVTSMEDFIILNEVYKDFFSKSLPARETVQVCDLPREAKIEISAIAVK